MWSPASDCLTPLTPTRHERSLYCVHAIGGTIGFLTPFAKRVSATRDVYGLQCHGIAGNEPDRTVPAMAKRYVEEITAVQPHGPYELVGYSMGGLIAFEIARLLAQRGEQVALAGMLDSCAPGVPLAPVDTAAALSLVSRAVGLFPPFEAENPDQPDEVLIRDFLAEAVEHGILAASFRPSDLRPMIDIYRVNGHAANEYLPDGPYKGDLHCLFTESSGLVQHRADWEGFITGELTVRVIDADHFTLMHEQHAQQVADTVLGWLDD